MNVTGDMDNVTVRPATPADRDFAFDVKKAALGEYVRETFGWDEDEQRRLHQRGFNPATTRIIVCGGRDVGLLASRTEDGRLRLLQLFLLPQAQRQGIGSQVLSGLLDEADRAGRAVFLRVLKSNPRARTFYERHGFAVVDETETHHNMERPAPQT